MNVADGYWEFPNTVPPHDIQAFMEALSKRKPGDAIVVRGGARFIPFNPAMVPDALCRYCWSPNLHTSTHCEQCGGPMVH